MGLKQNFAKMLYYQGAVSLFLSNFTLECLMDFESAFKGHNGDDYSFL